MRLETFLSYVLIGTDNPRYGKRATATGLQLTIGNCSGIMAPFIYKTGSGPRYILGHAVTLALVAFATILYAIMSFYFRMRNKKRAAGKEDYKSWGKTPAETAEAGDESPLFIFTY